jgi:hypothetical protein
MAKRLITAPGGRVIRKRPSRTRGSGLWKASSSSVKASGSSTTTRADSDVSASPLPSEAVKDSGGAWGAATFTGAPLCAPAPAGRAISPRASSRASAGTRWDRNRGGVFDVLRGVGMPASNARAGERICPRSRNGRARPRVRTR